MRSDKIGISRTLLTNSSLRTKALWMLGITMGLFAITSAGFLLNQQQVREARSWTDHTTEVRTLTDDLQMQVLRQETNLRAFVATRRPDFLPPYQTALESFDRAAAELLDLTRDNAEQQARFHRIIGLMTQWREEIAAVEIKEIQASQHSEASALVATGRGKQLTDAIQTQIKQAADTEDALLGIRNRVLTRQLYNIRWLAIGSLIAGLSFCILALVAVQRSLAAPMGHLTQLVARLTGGDLRIEVPHTERGDEVGAIARAIEDFRRASQEVQKREWLKHHLAALSRELSQQHDYESFATGVLAYLCPLVGAGHGVMFRALDDGIEIIGGYGYKERRLQSRTTHDGLAVQCVRSGKIIDMTPVPADYLRIGSGLGEAAPVSIRLWPLPGIDRVTGVIELASFTTFDDRAQELLDEASRLIGLAMEALGSAIRTRALLEETRAQAEELQASEEALRVQQEELRTANEALGTKNAALEEQGRRLRVSEEELRVQAEELRTTNDTLGEKSQTLNEFNEKLLTFQKELEVKNQDLEQASRYKSEFLANMSHELRTPLNSLLILAKDLADNEGGNLSAEQVESAQIIHESGQNLLGLINDILDLSKIEAGRMDVSWEDVSLRGIADNSDRGFRRMARDRGLEFSIDIGADLPEQIRSDTTKLMQILTNLLGNAFKFTHAGAVRLNIARPDDGLPMLGELPRAQTIALSVQDSGIGIPAEKLARLFQPFEQGDGTTSRRYGGTGLGLSISRALAKMLGGEIIVRSSAGEGSQFTLLLPENGSAMVADRGAAQAPSIEAIVPSPMPVLAAAPSAPAPVIARRSQIPDDREQLQIGDVSILVVEDDGAFARVLADMTRRKGYRVLVATDGESALELARRYRPSGILLDVDLPVMNGWAVMEQLKANASTREIPVHFVTANDESSRGMAMGAVGFITKPATRESLDAAFQRVLQVSSGERRKVLVVEDDASARHAVTRLLAGEAIDLTEAATAAQGLELLAEHAYDCIILDLRLPDATGFEFLDQLAKRGPVPPVVIYSARDLTREEDLRLREYTDSIVIKGAQSPGRLLDEVSLFLHAVKKPSSPTSTAQQPSDLAGRTVLVVDDDMRNVFALSKTLRSRGLKVLVAQDGHKALAQLEQNADVDWVLMDVMMPGMDGHEATREIRKRAQWRDLPVIAVTAKAMKGDREKCLEAGANDYLTKPIDLDKLLSMMRAWQRSR